MDDTERAIRDNQFMAGYHHLVTPLLYSPAVRAMRDKALASVLQAKRAEEEQARGQG